MSTSRKFSIGAWSLMRATRKRVKDCLYPGGNLEHEWSPDTLDEIRQALRGRRDPIAKRVQEVLDSDLSTADALDEIVTRAKI